MLDLATQELSCEGMFALPFTFTGTPSPSLVQAKSIKQGEPA